MSMVTIRKCTIAEIENAPNFAMFAEEYAQESVAINAPPHAAKRDMYYHMESTGAIHPIGAFVGDLLVGLVTILKPVLPHYSVLMAVTESLFVMKAYRKTGAGLKLIAAAKNYATTINSYGLLISAPVGGDLAEVLSHRDDCQETNRIFFMRLKDV